MLKRAFVALACAACIAAGLSGAATAEAPPSAAQAGAPLIAGTFKLQAPDGTIVDSLDLAGSPYGIVFGFLSCPDICPTTLADLSLALKALPPDAAALRIYFVSVDPSDRLEQMKNYVSAFDPRIVPLGGSREAVEEAIRSFHVEVRETRLSSGASTFGHTASVFLVDGDGLVSDRASFKDTTDEVVAKLRALTR